MPLHTLTVLAPRRPRLARAAAIAIACIAAGAATVVITDDKPAPNNQRIAVPSQTATRYFDSEATKIASMRALRRDIARRRADGTLHQDLEASKARLRRAR